MVGAQDSYKVGEGLFVDRDRPIQVACRLVRAGEVVARAQGVRVIGAEDSYVIGEGLFEQRDRPIQVACRLVAVGEVVA